MYAVTGSNSKAQIRVAVADGMASVDVQCVTWIGSRNFVCDRVGVG